MEELLNNSQIKMKKFKLNVKMLMMMAKLVIQ
jgi:hypothetical protein